MNALERFIEDIEKRHEEKHNQGLPNIFHASPRVTYGDLRRQVMEYRELKVKLEDWELHAKGMEAKTKSLIKNLKELEFENMELKAKLVQREGEGCENCLYSIPHYDDDNADLVEVSCSHKGHTQNLWFPAEFKCCYYTAKPKVRKMPLSLAKEVAARIWCDPAMSKIEMDCDLAIKIAEILTTVKGTWEEK